MIKFENHLKLPKHISTPLAQYDNVKSFHISLFGAQFHNQSHYIAFTQLADAFIQSNLHVRDISKASVQQETLK